MRILKFGGTSVGTAERMKSLREIIQSDDERKIVVLSALSGTTNALVDINSKLSSGLTQNANEAIAALKAHYNTFITNLFGQNSAYAKAQEIVEEHFDLLQSFSNKPFGVNEEKIILAQGELMSTKFFHLYLTYQGVDAVFLNALDFMRIDEDDEPDLQSISTLLGKKINIYPTTDIFITQGYICLNSNGNIDNLKRGGSDYTASLLGAAADCSEIQIWTDIDGMHNNDPRYVKNTFPIAELTFDEAAELAYFGAKILHPATVLPAKKANVPVRILNTMDPKAKGTLITKDAPKNYIKSIAAKDNITAINIKSSRMLLAYGFLRNVFEVFEKYKTSIDMITTSEVAISLTIDDDARLEQILDELEQYAVTHIDKDQSIICIVGDFLCTKPGVIDKVIHALSNIPIRMISYGGSENNISLLIDTSNKSKVLNLLNNNIFKESDKI